MARHDRLKPMIVGAFVFLAWPDTVLGAEPVVHDGMTKQQLAQFAERQGWKTEVGGLANDVTIRVGGQQAYVLMTECASDGMCRSGLIRNQTYYFIRSPGGGACDLWHWNMDVKGATGFGPIYVTLQRYIRFRGVTDQYLKDVIEAFVGASPSFWELVEDCSGLDRPDPSPTEE